MTSSNDTGDGGRQEADSSSETTPPKESSKKRETSTEQLKKMLAAMPLQKRSAVLLRALENLRQKRLSGMNKSEKNG